jgi:hypothetical protein
MRVYVHRSLDVLWLRVRGGPVRTCRVHFCCHGDVLWLRVRGGQVRTWRIHFRCHGDMHRLPRR